MSTKQITYEQILLKTHRGGLEEWLVFSNRIFLRFLVGRLRVLADDGKSKSVAVSSSSVCFSGVNISPFYPDFRFKES